MDTGSRGWRVWLPRRQPLKSILRQNQENVSSVQKQLRFRDQCKTSYAALAFFSKGSRTLCIWRSLIFCCLVYESWAFPFRLAFSSPSHTSNIFVLDIAIDSIMILDAFVKSLTSLDDLLRHADGPTTLNEKKSRVLRIFLANLVINLSCLVIYCISTMQLSTESFEQYSIDLELTRGHWIWWGCTIPRTVIRCRRLLRQLIRSVKDMTSMIHVQAAKAIALSTVMAIHWIGCVFFYMARLRRLDRRTWVSSIEDTLVVYERFTSPIYYQYILALFKGVSSISGVEFTPYLANNPEEQIAGLLMIIVQVYTSALILGTIIHFFALKDPRAQHAAERQRDLQQFARTHEIPADLEARLSQGLDFQLRKMAADNVDAEFDLSRSLEIKVARAKYSNLLQRCGAKGRLFQGCSEHFLDELLVLCSPKYFMASEEILKKGDISRDLIFLIDGAIESAVADGGDVGSGGVEPESDAAAEVISSDVPDHCPCVGEVAYFLGIMQPRSMRAHRRSDVRVVALSREGGEDLFKRFPDQRELICCNILRAFDLGPEGEFVSTGESDEADRDPHNSKVRAELHAAIARRREESFASLVFAAKRGDLDVVRMMLEGGMELHRDYDGRTVLAHAASAGVYKVCDVLLEEKANINAVNRWGQTPLDEAIAAKQWPVVQLLSQRHARMGPSSSSAALVDTAGSGDVDMLSRILRDNHEDPNARDYDDRTPLHLACANGHIKAVELLLACKANINAEDRWGGTPLEDAVTSGHSSVAYLLWGLGAQMNHETGIAKLCEAASRGNMVSLRMLRTCRVVDLDSKDYDGRTAVMVAASEGRVLATSYLLSCSCSPDELDDWGASALDRALQGGTLYHMYCAKLLQSWGGKISLLQGTSEADQALAMLDKIDIAEVRQKLKFLIAGGHDQAIPKAMTEYEIRSAFESCMAIIPLVETARFGLEGHSNRCASVTRHLKGTCDRLLSLAKPLCELIDAYPFLQKSRKPDIRFSNLETRTMLSSLHSAIIEGYRADTLALNIPERKRQAILVRNLQKTIALALEDGFISESEEEQILKDWDALTAADHDVLTHDVDALDPDEEAQLHAEVDFMMMEREYCEEHGLERNLYRASKFQGAAMRLGEMEMMYETLCLMFSSLQPRPDITIFNNVSVLEMEDEFGELLISEDQLASFFSALTAHTSKEIPSYEIEEMYEEAREWCDCNILNIGLDSNRKQTTQTQGGNMRPSLVETHWTATGRRSSNVQLDRKCFPESSDHGVLNSELAIKVARLLPLRSLIVGSSVFRQALLTAPMNELLCLLQQKTRIFEMIPFSVLQKLIVGGSVIDGQKGQLFYSNHQSLQKSASSQHLDFDLVNSDRAEVSSWFIIISGSLSLTFKTGITTSKECSEVEHDESGCTFLSDGQFFGANHILGGRNHNSSCTIKARTVCKLVKLPITHLTDLVVSQPELASILLQNMAESCEWRHHSANGLKRLQELGNSTHSFQSYSDSLSEVSCQEKLSESQSFLTNVVKYSTRLPQPDDASRQAKIRYHSSTPSKIASTESIGDKSKLSSLKERKSLSDFYLVQCGLKCIEDAWQILSGGNSHINGQVLHSLSSEVGEIGKGIFERLFLQNKKERNSVSSSEEAVFDDLSSSEFWSLWVALLADKRQKSRQSTEFSQFHQAEGRKENQASGNRAMVFSHSNDQSKGIKNYGIHGSEHGFSSSGHGKNLFEVQGTAERPVTTEIFNASILCERKDTAVSKGWYSAQFAFELSGFLKKLFLGNQHRISPTNHCINCTQTKSSNRNRADETCIKFFKMSESDETSDLFINSRLNPNSALSAVITHSAQVLSLYHFFSVPWRISFIEPFEQMTDPFSLLLFVPADALTVLYVFARLNTAVKSSKRNVWVTDRWEIYRKLGNSCIFAALPIDWLVFSIGGSYQVCLWFRMIKLLFCYHAYVQGRGKIHISKPLMLIFQTVAVIHVCCCFWYFIGIQYQRWDVDHPYSWFKLGYPSDSLQHIEDSPEVGNGFEYHGLACSESKTATCDPGESWYYYGMWYSDSSTARYLLSFYIVCTRVAAQGLIGNIFPQNFVEVVFSIVLVLMNLTVFRYVIGELSATVMSFNQQLVAARDRAERVLNFIKTNRLPEDLVDEIESYSSSSSALEASISKCSRVLRFLPHSLQVEVARHVCGNLLDEVCLFRGCSDHFKDFLIVSMTTVSYSPDEYIFRLGQFATEMFVVQRGAAEELAEDRGTLTGEKPFATARTGQGLGALALFFELRHMYSARASRTAGATCLRLSKERFLQLLKYCPEEEERITENAMQSFQKKFGAFLGAKSASRTGSSHSTQRDFESGADTLQTAVFTDGSENSHSSTGLKGIGKQARSSISHIKNRRRALRIHMLLSAARSNNLERTEWALQGGHINVNSCDDMGRSALHVAASEGHTEMVEFLLDSHADPYLCDRHGNSPLNDAVRHCHDTVAGAIRNRNPHITVSLCGFTAGIQLCSAAARGELEDVKRLVSNGVSAQASDYDKRTALHLSACNGHEHIARFLIAAHADVQAKDRFGNSPLDDAIKYGQRPVQLLLKAAGARVGWMRNGLRACRASACGDEESIRLMRSLVEMGLDPAACDQYERTPLHLAASTGGLAILDFLLNLIVDPNKRQSEPACSDTANQITPSQTQGATLTKSCSFSLKFMEQNCNLKSDNVLENGCADSICKIEQPAKIEESCFCTNVQEISCFINAVDRYGNTPLDNAIQRGNDVAALAITKSGGLRSIDPKMAKYVAGARNARIRWWQNARKETISGTVLHSQEYKIWQSIHDRTLPPLSALLKRIEDGHHVLESLLTDVLNLFHRGLAMMLPAKGISFNTMQKNDQNKQSSDDTNGSCDLETDSELISELEASITVALNGISNFLAKEMDEAHEATSLESLMQGRHLQPSCASFLRSVQALRVQLRYTCRVVRLIRKIIRSINTNHLAAVIRKSSARRNIELHAPLKLEIDPKNMLWENTIPSTMSAAYAAPADLLFDIEQETRLEH